MKKIITAIGVLFLLVSCNQKNKEVETDSNQIPNDTIVEVIDSAKMDNPIPADKMYACPMHPEVKGKLNDECPKCGMKLTEPVPEEQENK